MTVLAREVSRYKTPGSYIVYEEGREASSQVFRWVGIHIGAGGKTAAAVRTEKKSC